MRKYWLIMLLVLCSMGCYAEQNIDAIKMSLQMTKAWMKGDYRGAMLIATDILQADEGNRTAIEFVHKNWDKMTRETDKELETLIDLEDLDQMETRCEIYRQLALIHDNMRSVSLPLRDSYNRWSWQPELIYYDGFYDSARGDVIRLLMKNAKVALMNYDAAEAGMLYQKAIDKYLITKGEKQSNQEKMIAMTNERIGWLEKSPKVYDLRFCYELCDMSLSLNANQPEIEGKKPLLVEAIATQYMQLAAKAESEGDNKRAYELYLNVLDWREDTQASEKVKQLKPQE